MDIEFTSRNGGLVTIRDTDGPPPIVEFDAHGLAQLRIVRWESSGRLLPGSVPSHYSKYYLTAKVVSLHVTVVNVLSVRETLSQGAIVDFGGLPGNDIYAFGWCEFGPLEKTWAAIRHQYGLRLDLAKR